MVLKKDKKRLVNTRRGLKNILRVTNIALLYIGIMYRSKDLSIYRGY